jgi:hypothetical protein
MATHIIVQLVPFSKTICEMKYCGGYADQIIVHLVDFGGGSGPAIEID